MVSEIREYTDYEKKKQKKNGNSLGVTRGEIFSGYRMQNLQKKSATEDRKCR